VLHFPSVAPNQNQVATPAVIPPPLPGKLSKLRLVMAFGVAGISDALSLGFTFVPPLEWGLDLLTALLLFAVLGWRWMILPGLILEAIPGLAVFPLWTLVVVAVTVWGTPRPKPQQR
jgi:hypothetical protein